MKPGTAFAMGWLSARALMRVVAEIAKSDTSLGVDVRKSILGRMEFEKLLRLESEVGEEINRRVRGSEDEPESGRRGLRSKLRKANLSDIGSYPWP